MAGKQRSGNILDYIREYGGKSMEECPFNDVDSLVLCQLAYLKYEAMVPADPEEGEWVRPADIVQNENYQKLYADKRFAPQNRMLFEGVCRAKRFASLRMNYYISLVEESWEAQFCGITFRVNEETVFVAYRGTDESLVGWKEDFNMVCTCPVPSQVCAVKYLEYVARHVTGKIYVGGHSKGGNLAVYAAMMCPARVQDRIVKVYTMDGPGFRPEVLSACGFRDIRARLIKIVPKDSLIGALFMEDCAHRTVGSSAKGALRHDPYTWLICGRDFVEAVQRKNAPGMFLTEWIRQLTFAQLQDFEAAFFHLMDEAGAGNPVDYAVNWRAGLVGVLKAWKKLDKESAGVLKNMARSLLDNVMGGSVRGV